MLLSEYDDGEPSSEEFEEQLLNEVDPDKDDSLSVASYFQYINELDPY